MRLDELNVHRAFFVNRNGIRICTARFSGGINRPTVNSNNGFITASKRYLEAEGRTLCRSLREADNLVAIYVVLTGGGVTNGHVVAQFFVVQVNRLAFIEKNARGCVLLKSVVHRAVFVSFGVCDRDVVFADRGIKEVVSAFLRGVIRQHTRNNRSLFDVCHFVLLVVVANSDRQRQTGVQQHCTAQQRSAGQGIFNGVGDLRHNFLFGCGSCILSGLFAFHSLLAGCGLLDVGGGLLTLDRLASRLVGCDDGLSFHLDGETLGHSIGRDLVLARGLVGLELGLDAGRDLLHGADLEALGGCSGERQLLARRRVDILSFCGVFGIVVLDRRLVAQIKRDGNGRVLCGRGGSYAVRALPREVIFGFGRGGPTVLQGGQTVRNGRIVGRRRRCVVRLRRRSGLARRRVRRCGIRGLRALIRRALRLRCLLACALSCNSDSGQAQRLGAEQEREQNGERRRAPPDPRSANRALCVLRIH